MCTCDCVTQWFDRCEYYTLYHHIGRRYLTRWPV